MNGKKIDRKLMDFILSANINECAKNGWEITYLRLAGQKEPTPVKDKYFKKDHNLREVLLLKTERNEAVREATMVGAMQKTAAELKGKMKSFLSSASNLKRFLIKYTENGEIIVPAKKQHLYR